jgi:hypothetical protein
MPSSPPPVPAVLSPTAKSFAFSANVKSFEFSANVKSFEMAEPAPLVVWHPSPLAPRSPSASRRYPLGQLLELQERTDCLVLPESLLDRSGGRGAKLARFLLPVPAPTFAGRKVRQSAHIT